MDFQGGAKTPKKQRKQVPKAKTRSKKAQPKKKKRTQSKKIQPKKKTRTPKTTSKKAKLQPKKAKVSPQKLPALFSLEQQPLKVQHVTNDLWKLFYASGSQNICFFFSFLICISPLFRLMKNKVEEAKRFRTVVLQQSQKIIQTYQTLATQIGVPQDIMQMFVNEETGNLKPGHCVPLEFGVAIGRLFGVNILFLDKRAFLANQIELLGLSGERGASFANAFVQDNMKPTIFMCFDGRHFEPVSFNDTFQVSAIPDPIASQRQLEKIQVKVQRFINLSPARI